MLTALGLVVTAESAGLVYLGWRLYEMRGARGIRTGVADFFTDRLCDGILRKLGARKGGRVINEAMREAREEHRRRAAGVTL